MNDDTSDIRRLERLLASLLHYGTCVASAVIAVGIAIALAQRDSPLPIVSSLSHLHLITAGIALFILLPVSRVVLTLVIFLRARDYWFVAMAAFVLTTIVLGFVVGLYFSPAGSTSKRGATGATSAHNKGPSFVSRSDSVLEPRAPSCA
jgi:uncharacterized membrane protein